MTLTFLYEDEAEEKKHAGAIEMLAMRIGTSIEEIEKIYGIVLKRFKKGARVKDFLPILVSRRVEYLVKVRRKCKPRSDGIGVTRGKYER